jgi:hypothetical protein
MPVLICQIENKHEKRGAQIFSIILRRQNHALLARG